MNSVIHLLPCARAGTQARPFTLLSQWALSCCYIPRTVLGVLAAALCFDCEMLICLLLKITEGRARALTVQSCHPGMQPKWILQGFKSACQEMGHKGNNCQLNQIARVYWTNFVSLLPTLAWNHISKGNDVTFRIELVAEQN